MKLGWGRSQQQRKVLHAASRTNQAVKKGVARSRNAAAARPVARGDSENPIDVLMRIAEGELGTREIGTSNRGKQVDEYLRATWLDEADIEQGQPWCAAFVCWVIREWMFVCPTTTFKRPRTPSAFGFEDWAKEQKLPVFYNFTDGMTKIRRGDVIVYRHSHIGIASTHELHGGFEAVEGNSNTDGSRNGNGVYRVERTIGKVRSVIRLV